VIRKQVRLMLCILFMVAILGGCTKPTEIITTPPPTDTQVPPTPTSAPLPTDTQVPPTLSELSVAKTLEPTTGIAPIFRSAQVITSENAHEVTQLDYLGRGMISGIAWSPDGKQIAVAARSGIYLIDTTTYVENHFSSGGSNDIAYSPDGTMLASAESNTVNIYNLASRKVLHTLIGHSDVVNCIAFSPVENILASGSSDTTIKLWDIANGEELSTQPGGGTGVGDVAFSPDGKILASVVSDKVIKLWAVTSGAELRLFSDYIAVGIAFSPARGIMAAADFGVIKLWNIASHQVLNTLEMNTCCVGPIAFSPDGKILASGNNTTIQLWDVANLELRKLTGHEEMVFSLAFSPDGTKLASESGTTIKIWDIASGQVLRTLTGKNGVSGGEGLSDLVGYNEPEFSVAFSPNGAVFAVVYSKRPIELFDMSTLKLLAELKTQYSYVISVAFSPDGKLIAAGGGRCPDPGVCESGVQILNVATQEQQLLLDDFNYYPVNSLAFSPDSTLLATGEGNGMALAGSSKIWNVTTGELLDQFGIPFGDVLPSDYWYVTGEVFNPDGTLLATANGNGEVLLWDVVNKQQKAVLNAYVGGITFSPDGTILATSGNIDETDRRAVIRLLDVDTGDLLLTLIGNTAFITGITFSPNGQILASAGYGTVQLWDVETGKVLVVLDVPDASSVAFSPDGTLLATGGDILRLWGVPIH
jgi:WD40 repeat protein